jgi:NAD-dependent deacetylase
LEDKIEQLTKLFQDSHTIIALTGAGISTESGIPDFRTPKKGLWEQYSEKIVEISYFKKNPTSFYNFLLSTLNVTFSALPNFAHYFLTHYEKLKRINAIITQNIDGLHQKAGSENVIELHGNLNYATCLSCGKKYTTNKLIEERENNKNIPLCDCGGLIKPDVVFFGEMLPEEALAKAFEYADKSDLLLVLGSSLLVTPAALIPYRVKDSGGKVAIINLQKTPFDIYADIVINNKISKVLEEVGGKLGN